MAIEDAFQLANDLNTAAQLAKDPATLDICAVLREYQARRFLRVSTVHGMAGEAVKSGGQGNLLKERT